MSSIRGQHKKSSEELCNPLRLSILCFLDCVYVVQEKARVEAEVSWEDKGMNHERIGLVSIVISGLCIWECVVFVTPGQGQARGRGEGPQRSRGKGRLPPLDTARNKT